MLNTRNIVIAVVALILSFAIGRACAPVKVRVEEKIVEVEKKTERQDDTRRTDTHKKTTEKKITHPDGTIEDTTETREDTSEAEKSSKQDSVESTKSTQVDKESVSGYNDTTITLLAVVKAQNLAFSPAFGVHLNRTLLGPISVGVFGLTNGEFGATLGVSF